MDAKGALDTQILQEVLHMQHVSARIVGEYALLHCAVTLARVVRQEGVENVATVLGCPHYSEGCGEESFGDAAGEGEVAANVYAVCSRRRFHWVNLIHKYNTLKYFVAILVSFPD